MDARRIPLVRIIELPGRARDEHARENLDGAIGREARQCILRTHEHRSGAIADRRAHGHGQRPDDDFSREDLFHREILLELRERIQGGMMMVLGRHHGDLPPRRAVFLHVQLGLQRIAFHEQAEHFRVDLDTGRRCDVRRRTRVAFQEHLHRIDILRLAESACALRAIIGIELLRTHCQRDVHHARAHLDDGEVQRGGRTCARVLDVDQRPTFDAQRPQGVLALHAILAFDGAGNGVGVEGRADIRCGCARILECFGHGFASHLGGAALRVNAERRHAYADDEHFSHGALRKDWYSHICYRSIAPPVRKRTAGYCTTLED